MLESFWSMMKWLWPCDGEMFGIVEDTDAMRTTSEAKD
jgi:hypothetical protein